jgi:hypothetical protein
MAREIARSWEGRVSRRLRKKVEMLFAHLKRILKLALPVHTSMMAIRADYHPAAAPGHRHSSVAKRQIAASFSVLGASWKAMATDRIP